MFKHRLTVTFSPTYVKCSVKQTGFSRNPWNSTHPQQKAFYNFNRAITLRFLENFSVSEKNLRTKVDVRKRNYKYWACSIFHDCEERHFESLEKWIWHHPLDVLFIWWMKWWLGSSRWKENKSFSYRKLESTLGNIAFSTNVASLFPIEVSI